MIMIMMMMIIIFRSTEVTAGYYYLQYDNYLHCINNQYVDYHLSI